MASPSIDLLACFRINQVNDISVDIEIFSSYATTSCIRYFAGSGYAIFLLEHPSEDGNLLTKESLDSLWEIDARVWEIEVSTI